VGERLGGAQLDPHGLHDAVWVHGGLVGDHALHHLQHRRDQLGLRGQQHAQRNRRRKDPLAHSHVDHGVVHQGRCRLRCPPGPARGAQAAPLAAERQQLVVATRPATQRQSEVRQDAALEEGGELLFDKPRRFGASIGLDVGDGAGHMLLDPSVQRGLLGAVAFVGERVAIGRTLGLPGDCLNFCV
jgi:hypothetical protein